MLLFKEEYLHRVYTTNTLLLVLLLLLPLLCFHLHTYIHMYIQVYMYIYRYSPISSSSMFVGDTQHISHTAQILKISTNSRQRRLRPHVRPSDCFSNVVVIRYICTSEHLLLNGLQQIKQKKTHKKIKQIK